MRPYPSGLPLRRAIRVLTLTLFACALVGVAHAQHKLMIPSPFGDEDKFEVLALERSLCMVDLGFAIERLASNYYFFDDAEGYADGFIEINSPEGFILKGDRKTTFAFSVKARPDRDFTDCFVVLRLFSQDGRELLLPYEIDDLKAGKTQTIQMEPELAFDDLNRGVYYYHFFSQGREIYYAPTQLELGRKQPRPLPLRLAGSRDPDVERQPSLALSERLAQMVSDAEALVAIGVNDSGFSVDHTVLAASNPTVERVAVDAVKKARFVPGAEEGLYVRKDLLVRVRFDSRGHCRLIPE